MDKHQNSHVAVVAKLSQMLPHITYTWDDKGISALFADVFQNECRFNVTAKEWYHFDGKTWTADTGGMLVAQRAKLFTDALLEYCSTIEDGKQKTDYIKTVDIRRSSSNGSRCLLNWRDGDNTK